MVINVPVSYLPYECGHNFLFLAQIVSMLITEKTLQWRHQDFHPGGGHDKHVHKSRHASQECIHE